MTRRHLATMGLLAAGLSAPACDSDGAGDGVPGPAVQSLVDQVDQDSYLEDLVFAAMERVPESAHHQAVQDLCADRFAELGYEVERQDYGSGVNVIGVRPGTSRPRQQVHLSAHYDHIPGCPGADDNATGVAGVLEAARVLAVPHPRTLVVACWDEEERALVGSRRFTQRLDERGGADDVVVSFVLEMIGYRSDEPGSQVVPTGFDLLFPDQVRALADNDGRGDFIALIPDTPAAPFAETFVSWAERDGLPTLTLETPSSLTTNPLAADLRRSDHGSYWLRGIPAMMIGDTANFRNPNYHCAGGPDLVSDLDHDFATDVIRATVGAVSTALQER